jgi:predicted amidohydrolase
METELKTAIIQSDLVWENSMQNRLHFTKKIDAITEEVDVIILQEMFTTGFTNNAVKVAETMQGETVQWMLQKAREKNALLMGSVIIEEKAKFYNRFLVAFPNGEIKHYDKRHLFSYAKEDAIYTKGDKKLVFEYKGWRILPLVCYDLRFPVWARNTENYDLLIYVANWPKPRIAAWDILLKARAIENLSYVIGVNRVGTDFNGFEYIGHSAVFDAFGQTILEFEESEENTKIAVLDKNHVTYTREKFGFLNDKDSFKIL